MKNRLAKAIHTLIILSFSINMSFIIGTQNPASGICLFMLMLLVWQLDMRLLEVISVTRR